MKSEQQLRAERLSEIFGQEARKTIVIEFAGVPKAGKTTTLTSLQGFLRRCGFRVEVVVERASVCPVRDKKHSNFNVWTACTTLAQILEKTQDPPRDNDPHILILDRGLFDSICWLTMMEQLDRLRDADRDRIENFLRMDDWRKRITAVILMTTVPKDAMEREKGYPPVVGVEGSIMNEPVLQKFLHTTTTTAARLGKEFNIVTVDTSSPELRNNPRAVAESVVDSVLRLIEEHLQEQILCVKKEAVVRTFAGRTWLPAREAADILRSFRDAGEFKPRSNVEADSALVQALPVVVVRNKSGDVLRLRRREKSTESALHEEIVIWAGGHVREEDSTNGDVLVQCALRELKEELRLSVESDALTFLGAVFVDPGSDTKTSKHVALVYEWRAEADDVAVVLSSSEFFERRGTSLSGRFIKIEDLAKEVDTGKVKEPWSAEIVREALAQGVYKFKPRLF